MMRLLSTAGILGAVANGVLAGSDSFSQLSKNTAYPVYFNSDDLSSFSFALKGTSLVESSWSPNGRRAEAVFLSAHDFFASAYELENFSEETQVCVSNYNDNTQFYVVTDEVAQQIYALYLEYAADPMGEEGVFSYPYSIGSTRTPDISEFETSERICMGVFESGVRNSEKYFLGVDSAAVEPSEVGFTVELIDGEQLTSYSERVSINFPNTAPHFIVTELDDLTAYVGEPFSFEFVANQIGSDRDPIEVDPLRLWLSADVGNGSALPKWAYFEDKGIQEIDGEQTPVYELSGLASETASIRLSMFLGDRERDHYGADIDFYLNVLPAPSPGPNDLSGSSLSSEDQSFANSAGGKAFFGVLGTALTAGASFGGWKLRNHLDAARRRKKFPLANRLRSLLDIKGINDLEIEPGTDFILGVNAIKEIIKRDDGVDLDQLTSDKFDMLAPHIAEAIKQHVTKPEKGRYPFNLLQENAQAIVGSFKAAVDEEGITLSKFGTASKDVELQSVKDVEASEGPEDKGLVASVGHGARV